MRRMFDEKELVKISVDEIDKVVPTPSLAQAGYYMQVNEAGTGYQLASPDHLYCHPIYVIFKNAAQRVVMLIFDKNSQSYDTIAKLITALDLFVTGATRILLSGAFTDSDSNVVIASYMYKSGNTYRLVGYRANDGVEVSVVLSENDMSITDGVNQLI